MGHACMKECTCHHKGAIVINTITTKSGRKTAIWNGVGYSWTCNNMTLDSSSVGQEEGAKDSGMDNEDTKRNQGEKRHIRKKELNTGKKSKGNTCQKGR